MTQKSFRAGSMGPYIYEDTNKYNDGEYHTAFFGEEAIITEPPAEPRSAVNKQYVDEQIDYTVMPLILKGPGGVGKLYEIRVDAAGNLYTYYIGPAPG